MVHDSNGQTPVTIAYSDSTYQRALRALKCSPFRYCLLKALVNNSVDLSDLSDMQGYRKQFTIHPLSEVTAELEMMWLIQVGAIRREVDGQGITSRYRLAPIGRQLLQRFAPDEAIGGTASRLDAFRNQLCRWRLIR